MLTAQELAERLNAKRCGRGWLARCPAHDDRHPSLSINKGRPEGPATTVFYCHAGCPQSAVIDALAARGILVHATADAPPQSAHPSLARQTWLALAAQPPTLAAPFEASTSRWLLPHPDHKTEPAAIWTYRRATGAVAGYVCRFDTSFGKEIRPLSPCRNLDTGAVEWRWHAMREARPLYRLPSLLAHRRAPVILVEGEKTADGAQSLFPQTVATTSSGGAGAAAKTDWRPLKGRTILIFADHDAAGQRYAATAARCVYAAGAKTVILAEWPLDQVPSPSKLTAVTRHGAAKAHWDLADALDEGWTAETVERFVLPLLTLTTIAKTTFADSRP